MLRAARAVAGAGHEIAFVQTTRAPEGDPTREEDFAAFAQEAGAKLLSTPDTRRPVGFWRKTEAEVVISYGWPRLVDSRALDALPFGIVTGHPGDLPRYRGHAALAWAILDHVPEVVLSIYRMTQAPEAGPIIAKHRLAIGEDTYLGDVHLWLAEALPRAFVEALAELPGVEPEPQDPAILPLRGFPRRPEDARLDWRAPTREVLALIRASAPPLAGAFTTLEGRELIRIFRARPVDLPYEIRAVPGQVCLVQSGAPVVATGDGTIAVEECTSRLGSTQPTAAAMLSSVNNRLI